MMLAQQGFGDMIGSGLALMVVGMLVVFAGLLLLWGVVTTLNHLLAEKARLRMPDSATEATAAEEIEQNARLVAVLAAAATAALQRPARVRRVRFISHQGGADPWSRQGRRSIMASHRPRR